MSYSRRNFLKAAGSGVVLTAVTGETLIAGPTALPVVSRPFTNEKASFIVNGKMYAAEYEARTTLWEVISMKLGLTGTNRSCNRASCGACSVLVDGTPLYSCHTLATEAVGKKILSLLKEWATRRICIHYSVSAIPAWPPIAASAPLDGS